MANLKKGQVMLPVALSTPLRPPDLHTGTHTLKSLISCLLNLRVETERSTQVQLKPITLVASKAHFMPVTLSTLRASSHMSKPWATMATKMSLSTPIFTNLKVSNSQLSRRARHLREDNSQAKLPRAKSRKNIKNELMRLIIINNN